MRRAAVLLSLIALAGCSNLPYRVATKANDYIYWEDSFEKTCKEATPECLARAKKLRECKAALVAASDAATRGGGAKYQESVMRSACSGWK